MSCAEIYVLQAMELHPEQGDQESGTLVQHGSCYECCHAVHFGKQ
jgi:hypothetical protein